MIPLLLYITSCFITLYFLARYLLPRDLALRFALYSDPVVFVWVVLLNPVIWVGAVGMWIAHAVLVAVGQAKRYTNRGH